MLITQGVLNPSILDSWTQFKEILEQISLG